jgi:predicted GIY-YIG superfamily endonuclease
MKDLKKIGFELAGKWILENSTIKYQIPEILLSRENVLYAFVSGNEILYIGTTQNFKKIMNFCQTSNPSQLTNNRNHENILELLNNGKNVDIYVLEAEPSKDLRTELKIQLISEFKPKWNKKWK